MSAAPSWPLISSPGGANLPKQRLAPPFRVEFRSISKAGSSERGTKTSQICSSDRQNAKRRARREDAPARHNHLVTDCKSPKLPISQRLTDGDVTPPINRLFLLSTQYGLTIAEIRGASPQISTHFRVRPTTGGPVARLLQSSQAEPTIPATDLCPYDDRAMLPPGHRISSETAAPSSRTAVPL